MPVAKKNESSESMATRMTGQFSDPRAIAEAGEKLYAAKREEFERSFPGQFVAVDVTSGKFYHGEFPEKVLQEGREDSPRGVFHLIRVGSPGAFRVSRTSHDNSYWSAYGRHSDPQD